MVGLLADGWFYISSAGLLVSGVLFFFLLGQYRAANDAADQPEPETAAEPFVPLVRPVWIPDESAAPAKLASVGGEKPAQRAPALEAPAPQPAQAAEKPASQSAAAPGGRRSGDSTTGGVNPAVVYLQNIKMKLEEIQKETHDLAARVDAITGRDEALIDRLSELTQAVADLKSSNAPVSASVEPPAPKRARKAEPVAVVIAPPSASPQPVPAVAAAVEAKAEPEPIAEPKAAVANPALEGLQDLVKEMPAPVARAEPKPEPAAAPAPSVPASAPSAEAEAEEKPRRGPVWPV
ncbi:MAG: hypothetical protein ACHQ49_04720 [Elusimicrobiota bacterium]